MSAHVCVEIIESIVDGLETYMLRFMVLVVKEVGKIIFDVVVEVREVIDFC